MGKYIRKTNRGCSKEQIDVAINEIIRENIKIREAGRRFGIPEATLRRHLKLKKK